MAERWQILKRDGSEQIIECVGPPVVLTDLATQRPIGAQFVLTSGELFNTNAETIARATKLDDDDG